MTRKLKHGLQLMLSVAIVYGVWSLSGAMASGLAQEVSADADFRDQGEYANPTSGLSGNPDRSLGLQLVALGNGQFQGVLLPGGLPGNGWTRQSRVNLSGQRDAEKIVLRGDDYTVAVAGHRAHVTHGRDGDLGTLIKVNRRSPYAGLAPPSGAIVLFDGHNTAALRDARVQDGLLQVGTELIPTFRNYQLHAEFLVPYMPLERGQGRGNSGFYLQSRYEVQVLDSFGLEGLFNECGSLYRQRPPDLNMAFPPLQWQTYDITFHAPRFDACGRKCRDARLTVLHNGVAVHQNVAILAKTGHGQPEGPQPLPVKLQDHSDPVQFRNIWLLELP